MTTPTDEDIKAARAVMDAYHMDSQMPLVRDLLAMKPIEASRILLDEFNRWESYIATALMESRLAERKRCAGIAEEAAKRQVGYGSGRDAIIANNIAAAIMKE